jgi:hypothetical protein
MVFKSFRVSSPATALSWGFPGLPSRPLKIIPRISLLDPNRSPADDSVTPWSSSPFPALFPANWPHPVLSQAPPPNPIAAGPDGRRVLSRGGAADHEELRKIRCCPTQATELVNAVQVLILAG